jgi:HNH endonuclease
MSDQRRSNGDGRRGPRGALDQDELSRLADNGLSVRQMAARLDRSPTTVRYWLKKYDIQLSRPGPKRIHGRPGDSRSRITSTCRTHGVTEFALRADGYYRCLQCSVAAVQRWRRGARRRLIEEFGGACVICGFDEPVALEFHHLDRASKEFGFAARGITRSYESLRREARKCILLCSNCHAQVEAGVLQPPGGRTGANLTPRQVD